MDEAVFAFHLQLLCRFFLFLFSSLSFPVWVRSTLWAVLLIVFDHVICILVSQGRFLFRFDLAKPVGVLLVTKKSSQCIQLFKCQFLQQAHYISQQATRDHSQVLSFSLSTCAESERIIPDQKKRERVKIDWFDAYDKNRIKITDNIS